MLSPEAARQVLILKQEYEHLFFIKRKSFEIVYRPLTWFEAKIASSTNDRILEYELNNWIVKKCCMFITGGVDQLLTTAPAGIADYVAQIILDCSQFQNPNALAEGMQLAREELSIMENQITLVILTVFRNLTPMDVEKMTFYQQMKYLALAESILGKTLPIGAEPDRQQQRKMLSAEAAAILSKDVADKPDIASDNKHLSQFLTGSERLKHGRPT